MVRTPGVAKRAGMPSPPESLPRGPDPLRGANIGCADPLRGANIGCADVPVAPLPTVGKGETSGVSGFWEFWSRGVRVAHLALPPSPTVGSEAGGVGPSDRDLAVSRFAA